MDGEATLTSIDGKDGFSLPGDNPIPRGIGKADEGQPDPIYAEAKRRFEYCNEVEALARKNFLNDYMFAEGDSDNGYQWPNDLRSMRQVDRQPSLTINETRQHNLQIINDAKQNKPGVKIRPVGGPATKEASDIWQDIIRSIEYRSNAQRAYDKATEFQVKGGWGYWRLVTDYAGDDTFDQEILIRPINDPTGVFLDPDAQEPDKSDANFGFIFRDLPISTFQTLYPEWAETAGRSPLGSDTLYWSDNEHMRLVEYFRRTQVKDELLAYIDPDSGLRRYAKVSDLPEHVAKGLKAAASTQSRELWRTEVTWHLIVGGEIKQTERWMGKYVPIIMVIGEETIINGELDRKGHTRALKDPQRMYNYWTSSAVEQVALQGKTPWVAAAASIEGQETFWNTANTKNHSVLPYNHVDDDGNPLPPPTRTSAPEMAQAYIQGMQIASMEMSKVSGQGDATMGGRTNERTGAAIDARQRQGDTSTYHFIDNLAMAIQFTGKQLLDLIPKVYDTERVMRIIAEDGSDYEITLDPNAQQIFQKKQAHTGEVIQRIFNPQMGQFEVQADVGPNYATRQEEAWNAYSTILTQNPQLVTLVGDLLFRAADFPFAEEAAARLKRMVPPEATGDGPSQQTQQLTTQLQNAQNALAAAINQIAMQHGELKDKDRLRDVDAYNAETKRLAEIGKLTTMTPAELSEIAKQVVEQMKAQPLADPEPNGGENLPTHAAVSAPGANAIPGSHVMGSAPPVPGAKAAPDGHWYLPDAQRPGKYLRVLPQGGGAAPVVPGDASPTPLGG